MCVSVDICMLMCVRARARFVVCVLVCVYACYRCLSCISVCTCNRWTSRRVSLGLSTTLSSGGAFRASRPPAPCGTVWPLARVRPVESRRVKQSVPGTLTAVRIGDHKSSVRQAKSSMPILVAVRRHRHLLVNVWLLSEFSFFLSFLPSRNVWSVDLSQKKN